MLGFSEHQTTQVLDNLDATFVCNSKLRELPSAVLATVEAMNLDDVV